MFDLAETLWVRVRLPLSSNFGHRVHQDVPNFFAAAGGGLHRALQR